MTLFLRVFFILFFVFNSTLYAQHNTIDSLKLLLKNAKHDTTKLKGLNLIAGEIQNSKPDSALAYLNLAEKNGEKLISNYPKSGKEYKSVLMSLDYSFYLSALIYNNNGDYFNSLKYYNLSLNSKEKIGDKNGMLANYKSMGTIYYEQGNIPKALEFYHKSLKLSEELDNKKGISTALRVIGLVYKNQGDVAKAVEYYDKSLKLDEKLNDKEGVAGTLINIGVVYDDQENYDEALKYYFKSLKKYEDLKNKQGVASALVNIGIAYTNKHDTTKALTYFQNGLKIGEEINNKEIIAITLINLGEIYFGQKKYPQAITNLNKSISLAKEIGFVSIIADVAKQLHLIHNSTGNYKLALENYELYIKMRDSLNNIENQKAIITQQTKYEYDKQKIIEDEKHAAELKIQSETALADKKRQNSIIASVSIVLIVVAFFSVMLYNRFKTTHKQKLIIEKKEKETQEQKQIIEEKQKEITDSINYAQKIQEAYMPPIGALQYCFKNSFLFFQPKDIVSGDFYYINNPLDENGNKIDEVYLAAADCTGHGVPGSIMSIICCNALNEAILTKKIRDTGEILDNAREIIIRNLKSKNGSDRKDGMDICLVRINKKTNEVQFSGANNPLWYISNNNLEEIKGNKQPVGLYENMSPFTTHSITLPSPSQLFLFTDGYADQFGGPRGKKYKYTQLKEFFLSNSELSMQEQHDKLKTEFEVWKGELEQIDDVCVIGIKI